MTMRTRVVASYRGKQGRVELRQSGDVFKVTVKRNGKQATSKTTSEAQAMGLFRIVREALR